MVRLNVGLGKSEDGLSCGSGEEKGERKRGRGRDLTTQEESTKRQSARRRSRATMKVTLASGIQLTGPAGQLAAGTASLLHRVQFGAR